MYEYDNSLSANMKLSGYSKTEKGKSKGGKHDSSGRLFLLGKNKKLKAIINSSKDSFQNAFTDLSNGKVKLFPLDLTKSYSKNDYGSIFKDGDSYAVLMNIIKDKETKELNLVLIYSDGTQEFLPFDKQGEKAEPINISKETLDDILSTK